MFGCPPVDLPAVVPQAPAHGCGPSAPAAKVSTTGVSTTGSNCEAQPSHKITLDFVSVVRGLLTSRGISQNASHILTSAWRPATIRQYRSYWAQWHHFCGQRQTDPLSISLNDMIDFLTSLHNKGLSYSALNSARSTLVTLKNISKSPLRDSDAVVIQKLMKAFYNRNPSLPKYSSTWDVAQVLEYLATLHPHSKLDLITLSAKLALLLLILTGQRGQAIHLLNYKDVVHTGKSLVITYSKLHKTSKPGVHTPETILPAFTDPRVCVVQTFLAYRARTLPLRVQGTEQLFITTMKPFKAASRDTISRWVKTLLKKAGIDMSKFACHSTRAASTSAAARVEAPLQTILRTAGWTSEMTFRKFYNKPITRDTTFAASVMSHFGTIKP